MNSVLLNSEDIISIVNTGKTNQFDFSRNVYHSSIGNVINAFEKIKKQEPSKISVLEAQKRLTLLRNIVIADLDTDILTDCLFEQHDGSFEPTLWSSGSDREITPMDNLCLLTYRYIDMYQDTDFVNEYLNK